DVLDRAQLGAGLHGESGVAFGDFTGGLEHTVLLEGTADRRGGEAGALQLGGIRGDRDALADISDDSGFANTLDVFDIRDGGAGEGIGERVGVAVRTRGSELQHGKIIEAARENLRVD